MTVNEGYITLMSSLDQTSDGATTEDLIYIDIESYRQLLVLLTVNDSD